MKPGYYLLDDAQCRKNSAVAALLGGALVAAIALVVNPTFNSEPKGNHVAIAGDLFILGKSVCANNGGLQEIVIEPDAALPQQGQSTTKQRQSITKHGQTTARPFAARRGNEQRTI